MPRNSLGKSNAHTVHSDCQCDERFCEECYGSPRARGEGEGGGGGWLLNWSLGRGPWKWYLVGRNTPTKYMGVPPPPPPPPLPPTPSLSLSRRPSLPKPFTPKSNQCQISPATSVEILRHSMKNLALIAYSDERWLRTIDSHNITYGLGWFLSLMMIEPEVVCKLQIPFSIRRVWYVAGGGHKTANQLYREFLARISATSALRSSLAISRDMSL